MFQKLRQDWRGKMTSREVATTVKVQNNAIVVLKGLLTSSFSQRFFHYYAVNRHKMTTLTASYHAEAYSPDDNRYDLRFLCYPPQYESWPFKKIDAAVEKMEAERGEDGQSSHGGHDGHHSYEGH